MDSELPEAPAELLKDLTWAEAAASGLRFVLPDNGLPYPRNLTWAEVDPARHEFDPEAAAAVVRDLPPAGRVPPRSSVRWTAAERTVADEWAVELTKALVARYGVWAVGWRWTIGEGDFDGGIVDAWCCVGDSIKAPDETLAAVAEALVQWHDWLEELAERFARFLPIPADASPADQLEIWERAVVHLLTAVGDRTEYYSGWYGSCRTVLGWFLTAAEIPAERHADLLDGAVGGRFKSWVEPRRSTVREAAERLAADLTADQRA